MHIIIFSILSISLYVINEFIIIKVHRVEVNITANISKVCPQVAMNLINE